VSAISRALTLGVAAAAAARGLPAQGAGASVVRGVELFQLMSREPLARTTGTTRLQWLPVGMGYLESELDSAGGRAFYKVNPATGARAPLFDPVTTARIASEYARLTGRAAKGLPFNDFTFEWGTRAIQFAAGGDRFLYELERRELRRLLLPKQTGPLDPGTSAPGVFSPNFNYYAFIRDYDNLFLCDTRTGQEQRLTTGTSEDNLVGFLDAGPWFVWSPDSRRIAYLKADQRGIYKYPILRSLDRQAAVEFFRYPFTTDSNPALELNVVDIDTKQVTRIASSTEVMPFIRDLTWLSDGSELTFQLVNQWESRLELKAADPKTGQARTLLVDDDSTYLNPLHNFRQLKDGKRFTWSSERTGWRHIYLYDLEGKLLKQLTSGEWETAEIATIDKAGGCVYFSAYANLGMDRQFLRVKLDGTGLARLTPEDGYHGVSMDPGAKYYTDDFSSLKTPRTVTLHGNDGRLIRPLAATNVERVAQLGLTAPELLTLKAADGTTEVNGLLFKPADFDPGKRYPVIVSVYGGPHSKQNRNTYETTDFRARMAQLGFLVVEFDVRGTPYRGKRFQGGNYLKLGQVDVDDQAAAMRQLAARPYVDSTRVGVTGISHGGYMTLMMVLRYPDVFQVGAAGAPLTDVSNGPRQYIGRFMRTPQANPDGYAKANVLAYAGNLKGRLLIYHGTNDRNAVLTNTMQLVRKFVELGKPVDMMIYPDGVHVLQGRDGVHGMKTMISYFLEHLKPEGWQRSLAALWSP